MNPEEKKKNEEHLRFIAFLQKEMIKIEKELTKRSEHERKDDRKSMFLPSLEKKTHDSRVLNHKNDDRSHRKMNSSFSTH